MKFKKVIVWQVVVLLIAGTLLTGCSNSRNAATVGLKTFTVGLYSDARALDPAKGYDINTNAVLLQIAEGLFAFDNSGKAVPVLVKEYKAVDPKTYVYDLKDKVTFSDGSPLTADDVAFSLNRQKDPQTVSDVGWMFSSVDSITKTGPLQVTVKLKAPDALLNEKLATTAGSVISQKYFEAHKDTFGKPNGGILATGPYVFEKWISGSEIVLAKNKNYWDKSANLIFDKIVYKVITDETTRVQAFTSGQVDFVYEYPIEQVNRIKADSKLRLIYADSLGTCYLTFNTKREPFNDVNVRKAIYSAIDRDTIIKNVVPNVGVKANSLLFDKTFIGGVEDLWTDYIAKAPDYNYDLGKAKEYLSKTKVSNGFSFTLAYKDSTQKNSIALSVQQDLKELNIDVKLEKLTQEQYLANKFGNNIKNGAGDFDVLLDGWISDFPDPDGDLTPLYATSNFGPGGSNDAGYSNPALDKILSEQISETDQTKRARLLQEAYDIASEDIPYAPLFYEKRIFGINKDLDLEISASWLYNLYFKNITRK